MKLALHSSIGVLLLAVAGQGALRGAVLPDSAAGQLQGGEPATLPAGDPEDEVAAPPAGVLEDESEEAPLVSASDWFRRAETLAENVEAGRDRAASADLLFDELDTVLQRQLSAHRGVFRAAKRPSDPLPPEAEMAGVEMGSTVGDFYESVALLYQGRLRLLEVVTPRRHHELTGGNVDGVEQAKLEIQFIGRFMRYQRLAIPDGLREAGGALKTAPGVVTFGLLSLFLALVVFRSWRKWAKVGIPRLGALCRGVWRHHALARPCGEFLRYTESVRRPLEWTLLVAVIFTLVDFPRIHELAVSLRIVFVSVFGVWFLVSLASALAMRGGAGSDERSGARQRSLWILGSWLLVPGLGVRIVNHLAGRGTLMAWVWDLFWFLGPIVLVLLLLVWRSTIRLHLEHEARFSPRAQRMLERRGLSGMVSGSLAGSLYLGLSAARRTVLRFTRRTALGRTLVAEALVQSMARSGGDRGSLADRPGIDPELRRTWVRGESLVETAMAEELKELHDRLDRGWKTVLLVGPRGGGKSFILGHLAKQEELGVLVINCPHGSADQAYAAMVRALGVEDPEATQEDVVAAVKARGVKLLAWDDIQRLCRPVLGGQLELDRLLEMLEPFDDLQLLVAIDSAAAEYLVRLREESVQGASTVMLSAWTEAQIGELIETRAREAGMALDYAGLHFPRMLLEQEFDSPEEGLRAVYRRILWAESDGNPAVALRLVVERLVQTEEGDALLRLPQASPVSELAGMTLIESLTLRFLVQTDGATQGELVTGLRYSSKVIGMAIATAEMRGLLEENHGRYRVAWNWYRTVIRALARRNMLGVARQRKETATGASQPAAVYQRAYGPVAPTAGRSGW